MTVSSANTAGPLEMLFEVYIDLGARDRRILKDQSKVDV